MTHSRARGWRCHSAMLAGENLHYKHDADVGGGVMRADAGVLNVAMLQHLR